MFDSRVNESQDLLQLGRFFGPFFTVLQRCGNRAASFVPHDHDKLRLEVESGVFDAAHHVFHDDVARIADNEEIAESLIENQLG